MVCSVLTRKYLEEHFPEAIKDPLQLKYKDVCVLIANKAQVGKKVFTQRKELWKWLTTIVNKKSSFNFQEDWVELIGRIGTLSEQLYL